LNIYIAAAWSRREEMKRLAIELEQAIPGLIVNARWIKIDPTDQTFWQRTDRENTRLAIEDRDDATAADVLVRFTDDLTAKMVPSKLATGSRMVEMGMALQAHIPVIVVGGKQNLFDCLPEVRHVKNVMSLRRLLRRISAVADGKLCRI